MVEIKEIKQIKPEQLKVMMQNMPPISDEEKQLSQGFLVKYSIPEFLEIQECIVISQPVKLMEDEQFFKITIYYDKNKYSYKSHQKYFKEILNYFKEIIEEFGNKDKYVN